VRWHVGERVCYDPLRHPGSSLGTVRGIEPGGVHVELDEPVAGVSLVFATPGELAPPAGEAVPPPNPRGRCQECGRTLALRNDGRVRVHRDAPPLPPCAGSGQPPSVTAA
jgi:hypothetical protein